MGSGVADGLDVDALGVLIDLGLKRRQVIALNKTDVNAHSGQGNLELVVGAAVKRSAGDQVVAGFGDGGDRDQLGRLPGCGCNGCDTAFQRGDALFEHVDGRIHDPGVNVAKFLQTKKTCAVVGIVKG